LPFVDPESLPGEADSLKSYVDVLLQKLPADEAEMVRLRFGLGDEAAMTYTWENY
jgi:DNA-directed RNA polymerase sigma subunit (sigma70/sigma32)